MSEHNPQNRSRAELIAGVGLILIGTLFLLNIFFDVDFGDVLWPFFVLLPGVLIFGFSLSMRGEGGAGVAILGSLITTVGLLLLYQNTFDHFESWAYAWALVVPTSIGVGQVFYGSIKRFPDMVESGRRTIVVGVGIFAAGAFFFEVILGISGMLSGLADYAWPLLLIGLGVFVLIRNLRAGPGPDPAPDAHDEMPEPTDPEAPG